MEYTKCKAIVSSVQMQQIRVFSYIHIKLDIFYMYTFIPWRPNNIQHVHGVYVSCTWVGYILRYIICIHILRVPWYIYICIHAGCTLYRVFRLHIERVAYAFRWQTRVVVRGLSKPWRNVNLEHELHKKEGAQVRIPSRPRSRTTTLVCQRNG